MLKGKVSTLLLPYCLWCIIGLAISLPIIHDICLESAFAASLKITHPIGNRALWYVRTLMVFMCVAGVLHPCVTWLRRYDQWLWAVLFVLFVKGLVFCGVMLGPGSSPFYFAAGLVLSRYLFDERHGSRAHICMTVCLCAFGLAVILRLYWFLIGGGTLVGNVSTVFVIIGLWCGISLLPKSMVQSSVMMELCSLTAFVYFMHYPINDVIKHFFGGWCNRDVLFVGMVILAPVTYLFVAFGIKKYAHLLYVILSGGRQRGRNDIQSV